jgi:HlyD family secretion protein
MTRGLLFVVVLMGTAMMPWSAVLPSLPSLFDLTSLVRTPPSSRTAPAQVYRTSAVERGDIVTTVQAAGTLKALVTVDVGSQISGLVKELSVDFNSSVTEGQVIARVEPETYEARVAQAQAELEMAVTMVPVQQKQIERTQAELENTEARHASAKAETMRAEIALDDTTREVERKRPLARQNFIAAGDWERLENAQRSAQAQAAAARAEELSQSAAIRAAQAARNMAQVQLANTLAQVQQRKALLRQAQINLDRTYIRAPVTGTVINRAVSSGQTVAASLQAPVLFTIAQDLTKMQVEASVVEADVGRFAGGQPVTFTVDAYPDRSFIGTVQQIRKAAQVVQNVVTYTVVVSADNPDELLLPGMTANLQVVVARREAVLKVPNAALRFRPSDEASDDPSVLRAAPLRDQKAGVAAPEMSGRVFVLTESGEPKPVRVRPGATDGRMTEVLEGNLAEGQPVVIGLETARETNSDTQSVLLKFRLR